MPRNLDMKLPPPGLTTFADYPPLWHKRQAGNMLRFIALPIVPSVQHVCPRDRRTSRSLHRALPVWRDVDRSSRLLLAPSKEDRRCLLLQIRYDRQPVPSLAVSAAE